MEAEKKKMGGFGAFVLAILAALGIYLGGPPSPKPTPTPVPTATATATPIATPTTEPTRLPTPEVAACSRFEKTAAPCVDKPTLPSVFREDVRAAQEMARAKFVIGDWVVGEKEYTAEVARLLREAGHKATSCGLPDEVWIEGHGFSEHFDVVTSELMVWTHYAARCEPSKFKEKS